MEIDKNEFRAKVLIKHAREYEQLVKRVQEYKDEHFPGGWQAVQMSFLSEMADLLEHWVKQSKDNKTSSAPDSSNAVNSTLTLRFNDGTERNYTEEDFNKLKSTGMLWVLHPDAPMEFIPN